MTAETGRQRSSHARCEIGHTARKQEERRASRYNNILQGINRIFEQVIRAETDEVLGNTCLDVALELTGSRIGFIGEVGTDGLLHDIAISDTGWGQCRMHDPSGHRRPPGDFVLHGLYGQVIHERAFSPTIPPPTPTASVFHAAILCSGTSWACHWSTRGN